MAFALAANSTALRRGRSRRRPASLFARPVANANKDAPLSSLDTATLLVGAVSVPVTLWSEYVLFSTGCGLPPGPGGSLGALEGVSYLGLLFVLGRSAVVKVQTGTGLPPGPGGALGAVEGLAFLSALAGLLVAGQQVVSTGGLPPVPDAKCFGS